MKIPLTRWLVLRRQTGELILGQWSELSSWGFGYVKKGRTFDPAEADYSFASGTSKGRNLVKRLRRVSDADAHKLQLIDQRIHNLVLARQELLQGIWDRGQAFTDPAELRAVLDWKDSKTAAKLPNHYAYMGALRVRIQTWPPEALAAAKWRNSQDGCTLHGFSPYEGCAGCLASPRRAA